MASQKASTLTPLAISKLLQSESESQNIIVQIFAITQTKTGKFTCHVSDGQFYTKAYFNNGCGLNVSDQFTIISIKSHIILKSNIGITDLKIVTKYTSKLGDPVDWSSSQKLSDLPEPKQFTFKDAATPPRTSQKPPHPSQTPHAPHPSSLPSSTPQTPYQTIDDLYVGLTRWTILCRITRKTFRETTKKGTKILEVQLVDKSKKKIIGTFFNQAAVQFNQVLKQGSVYQISKGRIVQGDYNNSRNEKLSTYNLIFDSRSIFNEVSDITIIAKSQDTAITLGQVFQRRRLNQDYDVVAYVSQIKDEVSFQKEQKTRTVKQILLADPEAKITMSLNLWNWPQDFGPENKGKVYIFSRFYLKEYKDGVCLNNGFRSAIIKQHGHPMKKYQNTQVDTTGFKVTTQARERNDADDQSQLVFNTKDLSHKLHMLQQGETVKSILNVYINRFAVGKKWYYEACPKCKKASEKYSKCAHCGHSIEQTNLSFVLGTELSDFYGSLWITAHDELSRHIFSSLGKNPIHELIKLQGQKQKLQQCLQAFMYQPLKLKLFSKRDDSGRVKHVAGRIYQVNYQRALRSNLAMIKELLQK